MIGDDLTPFFAAGEFSHTEDQLDGKNVIGIFDGQYSRTGGGMGMSNSHPAYHLPSASVPKDPAGCVLRHKGVLYIVVDEEPDGTGLTVLILELQQ